MNKNNLKKNIFCSINLKLKNMKFVLLLLFISIIQAQECQFDQKEQCISAEGCVWNKRTNQCENHSLKNSLFHHLI